MAYTYKKRVNTNSKHSIDYPNGNPFNKNPSTGGNCTWWAWGRFKEVYKGATGKDLAWTAGAGNACMFYTIMGKAGYSTGNTPKPGAIICWGYGAAHGNPGHVAFVEQVYSNGDIEISQSGWSSGPLANKRITKSGGYHCGYNSDVFNGFIYNKVAFTNPDGTTANTGEADHPKSWYVNKYGNEATVYFALTGEGLSHKAACAIMGNMKQESGFNPKVVNSIGATGLCQWYQGRCKKMKAYNSGHEWDTIAHQIKYLMYELKNSYKKVYNVLTDNSKTLYDMTYSFLKDFEVPGNYDTEIKRRYPNAQEYYKRYKGAGTGEGGDVEEEQGGQTAVDMQKRASYLYSSDNYKWVQEQEKEETEEEKRLKDQQKSVKDFLSNIKVTDFETYSKTGAIIDSYVPITANERAKIPKIANSVIPVSQAMVETPFVEIDFGGTVIGTYNNSVDKFPNHISSLEVEKVNGEINKYTFNLVHQIRPGEDPNLIDRVISKVRYSTIKIRYGDYTSNVIYGDEKAIITNVSMNRDYVSNSISYTIYATSAGQLVTSYKLNFPAQTGKPSTIINDLLYNNTETSKILLDAFPGMKNTTLVNSKNLIPNNDAILDIDEKYNISTLDYVNYLVSCMSNIANGAQDIIRNSTYYISYENDFNNTLGGAFFKISEVAKGISSVYGNTIFEVNVGYPDNNYVMNFSVDNNVAWSLLYKNMSIADEYVYTIDNLGRPQRDYSPNLMSSTIKMNEIQKNWWSQMVNFPLNASITLKGLMKPVMLMNYMIVNVVFYGQQHITSGVYVITGQKDSLSKEGFRTTLALTRVGSV